MGKLVKVALPDGKVVDGEEVEVDESTERWTDVRLKDGTRLRIKMAIISAVRTQVYDSQNNPSYSLNMTPVVAIVEVPEELKKKPS